MPDGQIFIADESFSCDYEGEPVVVVKGQTRVREGHPLLDGREHLFKPLEVHYDIEDATAKPGEKRSGGRRKRSSGSKSTSKSGGSKTEGLTTENAPTKG